MTVLTTLVAVFLVLEVANVLALYFRPQSDKFNALGVFRAWEASKGDPDVHDLVRYLANWVAGVKLIFILLTVAVLVAGSREMKIAAVGALIASILTFYWRLFPLIRRIDARGQLTPPGYSKALGVMVTAFLGLLVTALAFGLADLSAT